MLGGIQTRYIQWPSANARRVSRAVRLEEDGISTLIFEKCIGFLDGSIIVFQSKPSVDPEAYFSRKNYRFNLQAICDSDGQFMHASMGYTASVHDSIAFLIVVTLGVPSTPYAGVHFCRFSINLSLAHQ